MNKQLFDGIICGLRENRLTELEINEGHTPTKQQLSVLSEALKINTSVTHITIETPIGDHGAYSLAEALIVNKTIKNIYLSRTQIYEAGVAYLADALLLNRESAVESIVFNRNKSGDQGAIKFAELLAANTNLNNLKLSHNKISDQGAKKLADALTKNNRLEILDLFENHITHRGAYDLVNAINTNQQSIIGHLGLRNNFIAKKHKDPIQKISKVWVDTSGTHLGLSDAGERCLAVGLCMAPLFGISLAAPVVYFPQHKIKKVIKKIKYKEKKGDHRLFGSSIQPKVLSPEETKLIELNVDGRKGKEKEMVMKTPKI